MAPQSASGTKKVAALRKENEHLGRELDKAPRVIEVQQKLAALVDELATQSADPPTHPHTPTSGEL